MNKAAPKVALLSTMQALLTVPMVEELHRNDLPLAAIILDGTTSEKSRAIDRERLSPNFRARDLTDLNLPNVPCFFVTDLNAPSTVELVKRLQLDYLVNAGSPRILKTPLLSSTRGVLNAHPGALPAYRGCTAVEWSIHNDDPVAVTAHFMNERIDEGAIVYQEIMPVEKFESYESIRTRVIHHQAKVAIIALKHVIAQNLSAASLPLQGPGTYRKPIPPESFAAMQAKLKSGTYESK